VSDFGRQTGAQFGGKAWPQWHAAGAQGRESGGQIAVVGRR